VKTFFEGSRVFKLLQRLEREMTETEKGPSSPAFTLFKFLNFWREHTPEQELFGG